jgi:hypothetical protein
LSSVRDAKIAEARKMRARRDTLAHIAECHGVSVATASRWTAGALPPWPTACIVCGGETRALGLCLKHYQRHLRNGDLLARRPGDEPLLLAAKRYLAAFERWLRDPTARNFLDRRLELGRLLGRDPPPLDGRPGRRSAGPAADIDKAQTRR